MSQIFKRSTNTVAKASIYGAVFFAAAVVWLFMLLDRSAYHTGQGAMDVDRDARNQIMDLADSLHTFGYRTKAREMELWGQM